MDALDLIIAKYEPKRLGFDAEVRGALLSNKPTSYWQGLYDRIGLSMADFKADVDAQVPANTGQYSDDVAADLARRYSAAWSKWAALRDAAASNHADATPDNYKAPDLRSPIEQWLGNAGKAVGGFFGNAAAPAGDAAKTFGYFALAGIALLVLGAYVWKR